MIQLAPYVFRGYGWIKACQWSDGLPYAVGMAEQASAIDRSVGYPVPCEAREAELLAVNLPRLDVRQ